MRNRFICFAVGTVCTFTASAQTDLDALRYSQTTINGTARFTAMGGAMGALGGDFSVLSINPAGIALYKKQDIMFTSSLFRQKINSTFLNNPSIDQRFSFNIGNGGFVLSFLTDNASDSKKWMNWNFGFGYNRWNNFTSRNSYQGFNSSNSLIDSYLEKINKGNGTTADGLSQGDNQFDANLAFYNDMIYPMNRFDSTSVDSTHYISDIIDGDVFQKRTATVSGGTGEYLFSMGGNYSDRLYFGVTLGIPVVRYKEKVIYEETDERDSAYWFKSFTLNQNLLTTGSGFNVKLGMIVRAFDWVRFGVAFHTPTVFSLNDDYRTDMHAYFDNGTDFFTESPRGSFDYEITTPSRAIGNVAFIIGKAGLISGEYELTDYSEMTVTGTGSSNFSQLNTDILNKYGEAHTFRLGTEWRYDQYSFRGGYAQYGSPFKAGMSYTEANYSKTNYTLGFGIRDEEYYLDFAYVYSLSNEYFQSYQLSYEAVPGVVKKIENHNLFMTMGVKF